MSQSYLHAVRSRRGAFLLALSGLSVAATAQVQHAGRVPPGTALNFGGDCRPQHLVAAAPSNAVDFTFYLGCGADSALPFAATFAPDESYAYVSLFGGFVGNSGCLLAYVEPTTKVVAGTLTVDAGPQEIAFTTRPDGSWRHGWVSCSSASSVVVFDRSHQVVASIAIPFDSGSSWGTAFPFGLAVDPEQSRVYVGTQDGSGRIWVIDAITLTLLPAETLALGVGRSFGRLLFAGADLVIPATLNHAGFQGSTAEVFFVDPQHVAGASRIELATSSDSSLFPSAQDAALLCDGRLFLAGFDLGAVLYVFDAPSRSLQRTLPTFTSQAQGKFQALGLSTRGLLAVADFWTNEISFYDAWREVWLGLADASGYLAFHSQLNELTFDSAGDELWVPAFTSDNLAILAVP